MQSAWLNMVKEETAGGTRKAFPEEDPRTLLGSCLGVDLLNPGDTRLGLLLWETTR